MPASPARRRFWQNPQFAPGAPAAAKALLRGAQLRRKVAGGWALGTFLIELPAPGTLRAIALAGFDFVVIDMEHSAVDFATLESLLIAARADGLATLVRVCGEDAGIIGKVLDLGAHGIMVPHVDTPERARAIVEQARFPPLGQRGFSPLMKYDGLRRPLQELATSTYVAVQIEGRAALQQAERIAAVPGVDALFVGPYDLALSLGLQPGAPRVYSAAAALARRLSGKVALGIYIDDPSTCGAWAARRFALQCVSFDGRMLADATRAVVASARRAMNRRRVRPTSRSQE